MKDKIIICKECGKEFSFTVGEQKFYESKGLADPVRCKECRSKRKAEREKNTEKTQEEKNANLEAMLEKFRRETVKFDDKR